MKLMIRSCQTHGTYLIFPTKVEVWGYDTAIMATPWDRITDDSYRQWLEKAMTPEEYNRSSIRERLGLLTDFETDFVQKQQQMASFY